MIKVTELGYIGEKLKPKYCYGGTHNITTLSTTIVAANTTLIFPSPSTLSSKNFVITIIFVKNFLTFPYNGYSGYIGYSYIIANPVVQTSDGLNISEEDEKKISFTGANIIRLIGSVTHNKWFVVEMCGCTAL